VLLVGPFGSLMTCLFWTGPAAQANKPGLAYRGFVELATWRRATIDALYGPAGFYRRERPGDHFRTSVHATSRFAHALETFARACGARTVVDLGAGGGELLLELHRWAPDLELVGVDLAGRPKELPDQIRWRSTFVDLETTTTVGPPYLSGDQVQGGLVDVLVIANEWLDDIPVDVVEVDAAGRPRLVHVDPASGEEQLGGTPSPSDLRWLSSWWPVDDSEPGSRAEVGRTRDDAWADVVRRVRRGVLVAIDYWHRRADRPSHGTLAGYRGGRMVAPVPDGSCDITAHVALDACASAGLDAGADDSLLTTQRLALQALGIDGSRPPVSLAATSPADYLAALARATSAAELLDQDGRGAFGWLVQAVGQPIPNVLAT
jgi:hypothetical protein